ncbi:MAG TPA: cytochrome c oxidase subunit 3 [Terriglobia bacterium]|nr:cytochrome c oxidase subunit 3 [Terriglobia bacterium]
MATTIAPPKPKTHRGSGPLVPGRNGGNGFGGAEGSGDHVWRTPARAYQTGMWMALAAIVMLFAAFTSALVVRKGMSNDWVRTALPRILYLNTLILLASSLTFELARRSLKTSRAALSGTDSANWFARWLYVTLILGLAFIAGQLLAWRELAARGVYLATNPSSSFFYLLTAAHGIHLLGGICALAYVVFRAPKIAVAAVGVYPGRDRRSGQPRATLALDLTALYWHFMDGLWIYLLILLTARL